MDVYNSKLDVLFKFKTKQNYNNTGTGNHNKPQIFIALESMPEQFGVIKYKMENNTSL